MPANTLPSGIDALFSLADRMRAGLEIHGPWLRMDDAAELSALLGEARATENAFASARARKAAAGRRFAAADGALTGWLAKARLVVMLALGGAWSERWLEAGFTHRGTNVPKRVASRIELAWRLAEFFARRPEFAVLFAGVDGMAARTACGEIVCAEQEVRTARAEAARCKQQRDAAEKRLRRVMHGVVVMLGAPLGKGDPRWLAFGLNQPNPDAPDRVRHLSSGSGSEVIALPETVAACERATA